MNSHVNSPNMRFQTGALTAVQCMLIAQALKTEIDKKTTPADVATEEQFNRWQELDELFHMFNQPVLNMITLDSDDDDGGDGNTGARHPLKTGALTMVEQDFLDKRVIDMTGAELLEIMQTSAFAGNVMTLDIMLEEVLMKDPTLIPGVKAAQLQPALIKAFANYLE